MTKRTQFPRSKNGKPDPKMNNADDSDTPDDEDGADGDQSPVEDESEPSIIEVEISDTQNHLKVDRESLIGLVRKTLLAQSEESASISLAIVDNATIHAINRTHLNHDWPTDVITIFYSSHTSLQGELIISAELAVETAEEEGLDPWREFALYVVHGLLHLCGHDDKTEPERSAMRAREAEILHELGLTNTPSAIAPSPNESERYAL